MDPEKSRIIALHNAMQNAPNDSLPYRMARAALKFCDDEQYFINRFWSSKEEFETQLVAWYLNYK